MEMLRCLIADDDELGRELIAQYLTETATCVMAENGREAVEKYQAACKAGNPFDFIIMDVMMPELDGNAAGRAIRQMERAQGLPVAKHVKIIVLTALNTPKDAMESFMSIQPVAHLIKPVDPEQLRSTVKRAGIRKG